MGIFRHITIPMYHMLGMRREQGKHKVCVRKTNFKLESSQLLFISIRQRELIRVLAVLGLSTYTTFSWSVHSLPATTTKLCDIMCCDMFCDFVTNVTSCHTFVT